MITSSLWAAFPRPAFPRDEEDVPPLRRVSPAAAPAPVGSWRYPSLPRSRAIVIAAAVVSAGLHAGLLFGIPRAERKAAPVKTDHVVAVRLTIPEIKELEEPEPTNVDDAPRPTDLATLVPMQADLPQIPRPADFVQQVNFTSLVEQPDFSNLKVSVIPETYRGGRELAEKIGKIFNLADLDRIPEPVLQQAPHYPMALKRDGVAGRVHIQFVVDVNGRVLDPSVVETTNDGFNDAAVMAVSRWKFRPGVRGGKRVNTRMAVPIVFELNESTP